MKINQYLENKMPAAPLKIIVMDSLKDLGEKVNDYLVEFRHEINQPHHDSPAFEGYTMDNYTINFSVPRFGSGEGKAVLNETIRGKDVYIILDVLNNSLTYDLHGYKNSYSPDDHYQDLKRVIAATAGKAHRITVIMPFMYESRQHKRTNRESLDNAIMLQELEAMGVSNIITFDAHDPRTQNAIPLSGFDNFFASYQFLQSIIQSYPDLDFSSEKLIIISPDEGAMSRAKYFANILGVDLGMFYKRRDYSQIIDGKNPIVAHEYLGTSLEGKTAIIIDDMIASGESLLKVAKEVKERGADKALACTTFGLFTKGFTQFDRSYEEGIIDKIITTNLVYQKPELLKKPWYSSANMNRYIASIIYTINHDVSIEGLSVNTDKINQLLKDLKR